MLAEELFGALSDGTPIMGTIDRVHPSRRSGIVNADLGDWQLTAQDDPDLVTIDDGKDILIESVTIAQINALRSLLATDLPEQLIAAAVAYGRGDAAPDERREIAHEADRVLAEHYTLAEIAQEPDMQAAFAKLSPAAQHTVNGLVALLDLYPLHAVEQVLDRILAAADAPKPTPPVDFVDDVPTVTVIDDGSRSGIRLERHDRPNGDRAWLDFEIGDVLVSIDLIAGRRGLDLLIDGEQITGGMVADPLWTLDDLRQLHADLGKLLADPRLAGALAEQHEE